MKNERYQGFSSFDFLTLASCLLLILAVSLPIIKDSVAASKTTTAYSDIKLITKVLIHPDDSTGQAKISIHHRVGRDTASAGSTEENSSWAGEAGKDPWGRSYHFAFRKNAQGTPLEVAVWSDGANGKDESSAEMALLSGNTAQFLGDDIGVVTPVQ